MGRLFRFLLILDIIFLIIFLVTNRQLTTFSTESLSKKYISCLSNEEDRLKGLCFKKLASISLEDYSISQVDTTIQSLDGSAKRRWCHEFLHYVGWELYQKTGNLFDAFAQASSECDSAMYHGVVEEYIKESKLNSDPETFVTSLPKACEDSFPQNASSGMKSLCYHGLGHAFMLITENDLNESLKHCDYVTGYQSCYTGVFMENTQSKQGGEVSTHLSKFSYDLNNPDYPCNILDEKYKEQCYLYKGISNVVERGGDFKQAFRDCLEVGSDYQEDCFWGVGSNIPGPHWSTQTAAEKCKVALEVDPQAYKQCIFGAMSFVVQLNTGDPNSAAEFCEITDKDYKDDCYRAAGISLEGWVTAEESLNKKCKVFQEINAQLLCEYSQAI